MIAQQTLDSFATTRLSTPQVTFLIGGTEPAGTNQLYHLLGQHSDICLPASPQPEPNYFSKQAEFSKGHEYYHQLYFSHRGAQTVVGEKSGRYLWHPEAAARILQYNPAMKLIFLLRDPIARAYSNYRFNCMNGIETLDFARALEREPERTARMERDAKWRDIQPYAYFDKGLYARELKRYKRLFPADQILVMRSEELRAAPLRVVERSLAFLGLTSEGYCHADDGPEYPSYHVRSLYVQKLIRAVSPAFLEKMLIHKRASQSTGLLERLAQLNLSATKTAPSAEVVSQLTDRYRDEMQDLQPMVDWDTSRWSN
jgi:hypothetical protein